MENNPCVICEDLKEKEEQAKRMSDLMHQTFCCCSSLGLEFKVDASIVYNRALFRRMNHNKFCILKTQFPFMMEVEK